MNGATPTTPQTKYPSSCMVRIMSCTRGKMHVVAPYHSCANHIPCQHKSVWLGRRGVSGQGMRTLSGQCMHASLHSIRAQKTELACGGVHPDRTRAHVPVTLVVPPATLAQAHDMAPQYPLHPILTSMRVRGGSAEGPWRVGGSTNTKSWNQKL